MASTQGNTTVIGAGTHIKGELAFTSDCLILGSVEGHIKTTGNLHIGEGATCKATIEGATVAVDGIVEGDVLGTERVVLNNTARVTGNIVATALTMAAGACLSGQCRVGREVARGEASNSGGNGGAAGRAYLNGTEAVHQ